MGKAMAERVLVAGTCARGSEEVVALTYDKKSAAAAQANTHDWHPPLRQDTSYPNSCQAESLIQPPPPPLPSHLLFLLAPLCAPVLSLLEDAL